MYNLYALPINHYISYPSQQFASFGDKMPKDFVKGDAIIPFDL